MSNFKSKNGSQEKADPHRKLTEKEQEAILKTEEERLINKLKKSFQGAAEKQGKKRT